MKKVIILLFLFLLFFSLVFAATEVCNGLDDDGDGVIDNGPNQFDIWYISSAATVSNLGNSYPIPTYNALWTAPLSSFNGGRWIWNNSNYNVAGDANFLQDFNIFGNVQLVDLNFASDNTLGLTLNGTIKQNFLTDPYYDKVTTVNLLSSVIQGKNSLNFLVNNSGGPAGFMYSLHIRTNSVCSNVEVCDGIDNDYDGLIDEDSVCSCYSSTDPVKGAVYPINKVIPLSDPNFVSYWPFNVNANDYKSSNSGVITSTSLVSGKFSSAYSFNGSSSYITVPNSSSLNFGTGDFSYCLWYNESSGISGVGQLLMKRGNANITGQLIGNYEMQINRSDNNFVTVTTDNVSGSNSLVDKIHPAPTVGVWHSACFVRKKNTSTNFSYITYIDGKVARSSTVTTDRNVTSTRDLYIGGDGIQYEQTGNPELFKGIIDDISIFNRALTACDINKIVFGPSACLPSCSLPAFCSGPIDSNAQIISNDENIGVTYAESSNALVDSNTSRKCEWVCKPGFVKQGNSCIIDSTPIDYYCSGAIDSNAHIISSDENLNVPLFESTNTLVNSNTSRKCEWVCNSGFFFNGSSCIKKSGGGGTTTSDLNSIIDLTAKFDTNLSISAICRYAVSDSNILVKKKNQTFADLNLVNCLSSGSDFKILENEFLLPTKSGDILEVNFTIPSPCEDCTKTIYVPVVKKEASTIPDNNLFLVLIVLIISIVVLRKKK